MDTNVLMLGGETVVEAAVENGTLQMKYGEGWEEYLKEDGEWKELLAKHAGRLQRGTAGKGAEKGKGKGKKGPH